MPQQFKAIDLFAGAGGLTQGLKDAGFNVVAAIEIDALATETYKVNHPTVMLFGDICKLKAPSLRKKLGLKRGELDLLAGCPPCQGFSTLRTRKQVVAVEDDRNDLIFQFQRLVEGLLPKVVMMENVPGLAKDTRFEQFQQYLRGMGYVHQKYEVKNVADYGVPQRRHRLIFLASREVEIAFAPTSAARVTVANAIKHLPPPGATGDPLHDFPETRTEKTLALIKDIPKDGGSRRDLGPARQLKCHTKTKGFNDIYGRMKWCDVAPTITTGCHNPSKGRFLHPQQDRNVTLREAALLQSFPANYYFSLRRGKSGAGVMIGNALPPVFIHRHAQEVFHALQKILDRE